MKLESIEKFLQSKDLIFPRALFSNYRKLNIKEKELIFLIYIINKDGIIPFDVESFSNALDWEIPEVMEVVSGLCEKNIITLRVKKENGKSKEIIDISNLYEKLMVVIFDDDLPEDNSSTSEIYNIIEAEFGRTLSPIEYETIGDWINSNISEELIREALKEAVLNGVTNLKYIHKILSDWSKKGYKKASDIKKGKGRKSESKDLFSYDWLSENE